jgi:hypothetical protein
MVGLVSFMPQNCMLYHDLVRLSNFLNSSILVGFPFILLANDFLHFLPTEGPLAFLSEY